MLECNCGCKRNTDINDIISCSVCGQSFYYQCVSFNLANFKRLSKKNIKNWKCVTCQRSNTQGKMTTELRDEIIKEVKHLFLSEFNALKIELKNEIRATNESIKEIQNSLNVFSAQIDDFSNKLEAFETENRKLQTQNIQLEQRVYEVETQLVELQQYSRINNLEINGIPTTANENVYEIINDISKTLKIKDPQEGINIAHRLQPNKKNKSSPTILVSFNNRLTKHKWMSGYKKCLAELRKNSMNTTEHLFRTKMINKNLPDGPVYLGDQLSKYYKDLLHETKIFAKESGMKYVWVRDCKIYIRKDDKARSTRIANLKELNDLRLKWKNGVASVNEQCVARND